MAQALKDHFGVNLAILLATKIKEVSPSFPDKDFIGNVRKAYGPLELKDRVKLISTTLHNCLPPTYPKAIGILVKIFGEPNPHETGMFTNYHWLMPVGQFIEDFGIDHPELSLKTIHALTQRNTGEYAIRPFILKYPDLCVETMTNWSMDQSFHVRRLSSEGLRPKLPWAPKLDLFVKRPAPVFKVLGNLKADPIRFVQKSVANNLNDYLKLNPEPTVKLIEKWSASKNVNTQWIIRHATRNQR
jgi:3-methyladenine DNA glycosylase AlkC